MSKKVLNIFTDGSSHNNGEWTGIGGWGAVLIYSHLPSKEELKTKFAEDKYTLELYAGEDPTTNQRMEIKSVIEAFKRITNYKTPVYVYSDSAYLINCMNQGWWHGWMTNGWKNSKKEPVANRDLWEELIEIMQNEFMNITWTKVKGHRDTYYNNRADQLAGQGTQEMKQKRMER
jgi:ribonuclease HI